MGRLKDKDMFEYDLDFPGDEEEIWWYVEQGGEVSKETKVEENMGVKVKDKNPNQEMLLALTEEGPLASGACPSIGTVGEKGQKALHEAINQQSSKPPKKPKKEKEEKAEEVQPKTGKEAAQEQKGEILKQAAEARKHAIALKQCNYSGELVAGLMSFSSKMETIFEKLTALLKEGNEDEERYNKILTAAGHQMEWYKQAEAGRFSKQGCTAKIFFI